MSRTKPTSVAGAPALLGYIATGTFSGLFAIGERAWHEEAFRTVVAALTLLAQAA